MNKNWKLKFYTIWTGQAISILSSEVLRLPLMGTKEKGGNFK